MNPIAILLGTVLGIITPLVIVLGANPATAPLAAILNQAIAAIQSVINQLPK